MSDANNDTSHYEGALLEEINDRLKGIQEGQDTLASVPDRLVDINDRLVSVESDVKVIKAVITDYSSQLKDVDQRVTILEEART